MAWGKQRPIKLTKQPAVSDKLQRMVIAQILQILGGGACNLQKTDDQIFSRFVDIACRDDPFFLQSGQNAEISRELSVEGLEFIEVFGFPQFHGTVRKGHDR